MIRWRESCERVIAAVHAGLPADADVKARRKALKGMGWQAHHGTAWGRKMWGRCVREYLAKYAPPLPGQLPQFGPTKLDRANAASRRDGAR